MTIYGDELYLPPPGKKEASKESEMSDIPEIVITENTRDENEDEAHAASKDTMLYDGQEILAEFYPVPYIFILKDASGKDVILPPDRLTNARIECPKFHVLLDHLMAVLWIYYSKKEIDSLESNQIHWALKILEGTRNKYGQYTDDVQMAIDHLTDAYVDICSKYDVSKMAERTYPLQNDYSRHKGDSLDRSGGYETFKEEIRPNMVMTNTSLHLADMISDATPEVIHQLVADDQTKDRMENNAASCWDRYGDTTIHEGNQDDEKHKTIISLRNSKFSEVLNTLEEIRRLNETLDDLPLHKNDELNVIIDRLSNRTTVERKEGDESS